MTDLSDAQIVRMVLERLRADGRVSLRAMAEAVPVSRGTLNRWQQGETGLNAQTRVALLRWLDMMPEPDAGYQEGLEVAIGRLRSLLHELEEIRTLAARGRGAHRKLESQEAAEDRRQRSDG